MVELADTQDLGSCAARREGSSPFSGTDEKLWLAVIDKVTVGRDGTMVFRFRNGVEIAA